MPDTADTLGTTRRRGACGHYLLAGSLALAGAVILLALFGADGAYLAGLVDERYPYPCSLPEARDSSTTTRPIPKGVRLVVPTLGVDVGVTGGDPDRALSKGAYHHVESAEPGEDGNVAIAGHRNRRVFSLLYRLKPGQPIVLYWNGVEHDYRVTRVFSVGPEDTEILEPGSSEQLTLYTCRPRFLGNTRTVVVAGPVTR